MTTEGGEAGVLAQESVYAGLEALRAAGRLDLCAYLHVAEGEGPQLFLGVPDLGTIQPSEAFSLFSALRDALDEAGEDGRPLSIGGYLAVAVRTTGPRSRGLHVIGRRAGAFQDVQREALVTLAGTFASLTHGIEALSLPRPEPGEGPARVAVETSAGTARAEVAVPLGDELRTGTGESPSATRAVALAVVDAVDASLKLADVNEGDIAGERAVLVLVRDELGRSALGSALVGESSDILAATATATLSATNVGHARRA